MAQSCKQITIEKPGLQYKDAVFFSEVPIPDVPDSGARIKVFCAGVCYTRKGSLPLSPAVPGIKDTSIFSGYEVAGLIDMVGSTASQNCNLKCGDKVIIYPYEDLPSYAEYISVRDINYLIKVPENVPLSIAATLPTGALWAINAVTILQSIRKGFNSTQSEQPKKLQVLVVGAGGLSLWILRIANYFLSQYNDISLTVAALKDDSITVAKEHGNCSVISWNEDMYESLLLERCKNACEGDVDVCLDYSASPTRLGRTVKCMRQNGIVLVGPECGNLEMECSDELMEKNIKLQKIGKGSLQQLKELVNLIGQGKIQPPKHCVFPANDAQDVIRDLSKGKISGRAVLEFNKSD